MRTSTLLCFSLLFAADASFAQARTAPPAQTAPAPRRPAPAAAAASRSGIAMTVTDAHGLPIPGVRVTIAGPSDRNGETDDGGQVNFVGMQPGTYRARFDADKVISFEREVVVRAGQPTGVDVTLNLAPPTAAPPPAPAPAPAAATAEAAVGPAGMPAATSVIDLLDKQFIGKQPRRETLIACTGNTRPMSRTTWSGAKVPRGWPGAIRHSSRAAWSRCRAERRIRSRRRATARSSCCRC